MVGQGGQLVYFPHTSKGGEYFIEKDPVRCPPVKSLSQSEGPVGLIEVLSLSLHSFSSLSLILPSFLVQLSAFFFFHCFLRRSNLKFSLPLFILHF